MDYNDEIAKKYFDLEGEVLNYLQESVDKITAIGITVFKDTPKFNGINPPEFFLYKFVIKCKDNQPLFVQLAISGLEIKFNKIRLKQFCEFKAKVPTSVLLKAWRELHEIT